MSKITTFLLKNWQKRQTRRRMIRILEVKEKNDEDSEENEEVREKNDKDSEDNGEVKDEADSAVPNFRNDMLPNEIVIEKCVTTLSDLLKRRAKSYSYFQMVQYLAILEFLELQREGKTKTECGKI